MQYRATCWVAIYRPCMWRDICGWQLVQVDAHICDGSTIFYMIDRLNSFLAEAEQVKKRYGAWSAQLERTATPPEFFRREEVPIWDQYTND